MSWVFSALQSVVVSETDVNFALHAAAFAIKNMSLRHYSVSPSHRPVDCFQTECSAYGYNRNAKSTAVLLFFTALRKIQVACYVAVIDTNLKTGKCRQGTADMILF
jgi:hypothetical protein